MKSETLPVVSTTFLFKTTLGKAIFSISRDPDFQNLLLSVKHVDNLRPVCILGFLITTDTSQSFSRKPKQAWPEYSQKLDKTQQIAIGEMLKRFLFPKDLAQKRVKNAVWPHVGNEYTKHFHAI